MGRSGACPDGNRAYGGAGRRTCGCLGPQAAAACCLHALTARCIRCLTIQLLAGALVVAAGYDTTFLTLSEVAAVEGALFWLAMPETHTSALSDTGRASPS